MHLQGMVVMAIAALAAAFLAWRVAGPFVRGSASSGCHGCSMPCELKTIANRKPCGDSATLAVVRVVKRAGPKQQTSG